ncbi:hypothetical protein EVAR_33789_1 [Eumeta japonica]|uniref:Uncharacterized protein n=1 Tax=Eumeta variegata TaxID=151549 RepID=A0A4C1VVV6_EUMVA|nr:hypothetical protein EVAR_33789_1 [Eumeta japonica]
MTLRRPDSGSRYGTARKGCQKIAWLSDRRSFSVLSRFSIVEFLRSGRSGDPPLHHHSQRRPWRSRTMWVYLLTTPFDLRLSQEIFKFGPLKWSHHHWTVGVISPTRRRLGMRQHKSSVPHLHPQEKGCGRSPNECRDGMASDEDRFSDSGRFIITIPKAGKDPRKPENLRSITLLSHVAKTFERALLSKLRLLSPRQEQYGYPSGHSPIVLHYLASEKNGKISTLRGHFEDWEDDVVLPLYADDNTYFASSRRVDFAARKVQRVFAVLPE